MTAKLRQVDSFEVVSMAPLLFPLLDPACKTTNGRCTAWDVIEACLRRDQQIWIAEDAGKIIAMGVTMFIDYPRLKSFKVLMGMGYKRALWQHFMRDLMAYGKVHGATLFETHTRPGWERIFKGLLTKSHIFLEARL